jgi:hypothetical protein
VETANETQAIYQRAMGPELGLVFYALFCEICHLHQKWGQFAELFGRNEERIALLNRAAPAFFGSLQQVLWNDVLLHIARINDNTHSGGPKRRNLTLSGFAEMVSEDDFKTKLISQMEKAKHASAFCRDWRNRLLAHTDFEVAVRKSTRPIEDASRLKVREALIAIVDFINLVNVRYGESPLLFDNEWGGEDAQGLLYVLNDGLQLEDLRLSHVREGRIVPENLRSRPF